MTTIRIENETLRELKDIGLRSDSYEKILRMLIDDFKQYSPRYKAIVELKELMEKK
jgi:hypothetical protein